MSGDGSLDGQDEDQGSDGESGCNCSLIHSNIGTGNFGITWTWDSFCLPRGGEGCGRGQLHGLHWGTCLSPLRGSILYRKVLIFSELIPCFRHCAKYNPN